MWPPVSPSGGLISADDLQRFFCVSFEPEDQGLNSPKDYDVKLIFVWSCNTIFNKVPTWRTKRAVVISFSCESSCPSGPCMSPFCPPSPSPLPPFLLCQFTNLRTVTTSIPLARVHERCSSFFCSLTTLIFRQIPGYK